VEFGKSEQLAICLTSKVVWGLAERYNFPARHVAQPWSPEDFPVSLCLVTVAEYDLSVSGTAWLKVDVRRE